MTSKAEQKPSDSQVTEVTYGAQNVVSKSLAILEDTKQTLDLCGDSNGPAAILAAAPVHKKYFELKSRGVRIRHIVEITSDNIEDCKKMMAFSELRHLDGLKGYFAILDSKIFASNTTEMTNTILPRIVTVNVRGLAEQQQYFFDTLWNNALPAAERILYLEKGIEPERTKVWDGEEYVARRALEVLASAYIGYDHCVDAKGPSIIATNNVIKQAYIQLSKRGGKIRLITEINESNLHHCKELLTFVNLRHMSGTKGNFGVVDGKRYGGIAETIEGKAPSKYIDSNVRPFVEQQQYFFDMLWEKAIPAEDRIKQLEEGIEPERTEVWRDQNTVMSKSLEAIKNVEKGYDFCIDWKGPSIIITLDYIKKAYLDIVSRGGKLRLITEIVPENVAYCKDLAEFIELRHLHDIKGNFGIIDRKTYGGTANTRENEAPGSYIYSTVKEFVDQQQYFFETLWKSALPAEDRIREIEEGVEPEVTRIVTGWENMFAELPRMYSRAINQVNACQDSKAPEIMVKYSLHKPADEFVKRGGRVRMITEITKENLPYVKIIMANHEVRHLSGISVNFGYSERDFSAPTSFGSHPQVVVSNSKEAISQHRYMFDTLWSKAIPAKERIRELEQGDEPEVTEIWTDQDTINSRSIEILGKLKKKYDLCTDSKAPPAIVAVDTMRSTYQGLSARGVKLRIITEILPSNLKDAKELAKFAELRHLDNIKGNFGVGDEKYYSGASRSGENAPPSTVIFSTIKEFVQQQQYFFETLWNKAIPAQQRTLELEMGIRPRTIEVIQDTHISIARAFNIMKSVEKEYCILFASARTFLIAAKTSGVADAYGGMVRRGVRVRILVPNSEHDEATDSSISLYSKQLLDAAPGIELKVSDANIESQISFLIADKKEVITWELRDDRIDDPYEAGGVAIYSNIDGLATSYMTIFENLWKVTDLTSTLRAANIKLEDSHRAMKDFINVAAHELRTPIQPILGLSQILHKNGSGEHHSVTNPSELLEVIERNARRLDRLAEDILDVARIESGTMKLNKQDIDLWAIILRISEEYNIALLAEPSEYGSGRKVIICNRKSPEDTNGPVIVSADSIRISQVISNLLRNAIKFSGPESNITINLGRDTTNKAVLITISDSGPGIHPAVLPKLFEKFVSKSEKGTGLGLFISKGIIEAHGGKIWAKNNDTGKGATFAFAIPARG